MSNNHSSQEDGVEILWGEKGITRDQLMGLFKENMIKQLCDSVIHRKVANKKEKYASLFFSQPCLGISDLGLNRPLCSFVSLCFQCVATLVWILIKTFKNIKVRRQGPVTTAFCQVKLLALSVECGGFEKGTKTSTSCWKWLKAR